jgi:hypothetical protein
MYATYCSLSEQLRGPGPQQQLQTLLEAAEVGVVHRVPFTAPTLAWYRHSERRLTGCPLFKVLARACRARLFCDVQGALMKA